MSAMRLAEDRRDTAGGAISAVGVVASDPAEATVRVASGRTLMGASGGHACAVRFVGLFFLENVFGQAVFH